MSSIKHVVVAIAMEAEAAPFIEHLNLTLVDDFFPPQTPFQAYSGNHPHPAKDGAVTKVTVVTNGKDSVYATGVDNIGTVPAALATFLTLHHNPDVDLLINAACGSNHGVLDDGESNASYFDPATIVEALNFKLGICTTGNSLDATSEDEKHMLANDSSVKDMEAAAIAWCCEMHKKPFMGLKVVTDIVDGGLLPQEEFLANLQAASESLQKALPQLLDYVVSGKTD